MTTGHDTLKEAIDITLEARALAKTLSDTLEQLAESGVADRGQLDHLATIAKACRRLLGDVVASIEDVSPEIESLRRRSRMERP
ncbi:hypothetical protein EOS93_10095 [Rhizobium sp. RMa-01]|uniref:hypothetical protein n=1 Tax=unclassified Rhizobium TaxID=2613769 RepID=UPI0008D8DE2C|nr:MULTISPECIES: hypothetical protein [unclassified Rhizobium]OHV26236.1 hypothetical protein BBJ66_05835 [Rhizobium sp. RSm-3]RVU11150.1 hypothetical protein EOS93_10095 [Rhizobium sp. RMa-01]